MQSTTTNGEDLQLRMQRMVRGIRHSLPGVTGALLASLDGRPLASDLEEGDERVAAIIASSLGLGVRLAELTGDGPMSEIVVRSTTGYVVVYRVGSLGALVVMTQPSANLALLHLKARSVTEELRGR